MLTVRRVAAAVLLSSLMACAAVAQSEAPAEFSFRSLDGGSVTSSDLRGKVAVLIFGDARLRVTKEQAESVRLLSAEFAPKGVAFYLVSTDSETPGSKNYATDEGVREHLRRRGLQLPVLRDPGGGRSGGTAGGISLWSSCWTGRGASKGNPSKGSAPKAPSCATCGRGSHA